MMTDRFVLFNRGMKKCSKVAALIFVLLGLGFNGCVANNDNAFYAYDDWLKVVVSDEIGVAEDDVECKGNDESESESLDTNFTYTEPIIALHPFALALREYFDGGLPVPDYWGIPSNNAFWVNIDDDGTQGVLAIRFEMYDLGTLEALLAFGRVFYFSDENLYYKDFGPQGFPSFTGIIAENNRIASLTIGSSWSDYVLFGIVDGELIETFAISIILQGNDTHRYLFPNGRMVVDWWENREKITEEEFEIILIKYGFHSAQFEWQDIVDESDMILSMTIE